MLQSNMFAMMGEIILYLYNLPHAFINYIYCSPVNTLAFYCLTYFLIIVYVSSLHPLLTKILEEGTIQRHLPTPPTKCRYQKNLHKHRKGIRRGSYNHQWLHHSPIKMRPTKRTWLGEHTWDPILSQDYSLDFEKGCKFPHYFDATRHILEGIG